MTKADLIDKIASECGVSKKQASAILSTTLGSITSALRRGERVSLEGLGTFSVSQRKARAGRTPQTGAVIKVSAHKVARFIPGSQLRHAIRKPKAEQGTGSDAFLEGMKELAQLY